MLFEWILLSLKSLWSRKFATLLTCLALTVSVSLLVGIERVRLGVRQSFSSTVSQTDLIVGGRNGSIALLLSSVFHIGNPTNNIDIQSFNFFKKHPAVKWVIPVSMGDSHKGYRVIATTSEYFQNYRYGEAQSLRLKEGKWFEQPFDVVLGSEVAKKLNYRLGLQIIISHGQSEVSLMDHADRPFVVTGILESTQTPVDRGVYISLESMEAIHASGEHEDHRESQKSHVKSVIPDEISFFLLGTQSRLDSLRLLREINAYEKEPLLAIIPSLTLAELWTGFGYAESALRLVSYFVILATLLGLFISLYTTLSERRREMSIFRAVGASSRMIILMVVFESLSLTLLGTFFGVILGYLFLLILGPFISSSFGINISWVGLHWMDFGYLLIINFIGLVTGFFVGYKAYKNNLHDGLQVDF